MPILTTIANVLLPLAIDAAYSYATTLDLKLGDHVTVPLQNRFADGVVWGFTDASNHKLKQVKEKLDIPPLSQEMMAFITWVANYTNAPLGSILNMALYDAEKLLKESPRLGVRYLSPPDKITPARQKLINVASDGLLRAKTDLAREAGISLAVINTLLDEGCMEVTSMPPPKPPKLDPHTNAPMLSEEQTEAVEILQELNDGFSVTLLEGVTGSGKTEVYGEAIAETLKKGKQVLLLMPEIALTPAFFERFTKRFSNEPLTWHSSMSEGKRTFAYKSIINGEAQLVIGARSALFLPFKNLGLVVIDEEHDGSYKQEEGTRYSARDMAVVRAKIEGFPLILASATPSIETRVNAEQGKYHHLQLKSRYGKGELPEITLVDLKKYDMKHVAWIAPPLRDAITQALDNKTQVLLFLNRRGFAPLTLCKGCGERITCPHCTSYLTDHRFKNRMVCHHCGHSIEKPKNCFKCESTEFVSCGPGVERLAEEAIRLFPHHKTLILSSDMAGGMTRLKQEIASVEKGEVDIIIGTQLVAKGHHFPKLALVGVIDADLALSQADPRAAERTFQMLKQVTGRAGREGAGARAMLQTYTPDHPVMQAIKSNDNEKFYKTEINMREKAKLPPFGRLAALIISSDNAIDAMRYARELVKRAPQTIGVNILGPVEAPLAMLNNRARVRILVKASKDINVSNYMRDWLELCPPVKGQLKREIDIEPQSFM